jgi:tryptophan synthase beta chain
MTLQPDDVTVICLSGRGDKDMQTYLDYFGY